MINDSTPLPLTSTPPLPLEIVAQIAAEVRTGCTADSPAGAWSRDVSSLSLVSKNFLATCQAELFRSITLVLPYHAHSEKGYLSSKGTHFLFSDLIVESPHLAAYVRGLTIFLNKSIFQQDGGSALAASLKALRIIKRLQVYGYLRRMSAELDAGYNAAKYGRCRSALQQAIISLVEAPSLDSLKLCDMEVSLALFKTKCPSIAIANCYFRYLTEFDEENVQHLGSPRSFESLELDVHSARQMGDRWFDWFDDVARGDDREGYERLQSILGSPTGYDEYHSRRLEFRSKLSKCPWFNFAGLKRLCMPVARPESSDRKAQDFILRQTGGLNELHIYTMKAYTDSGIDIEESYVHHESALASLNVKSYQTLSTLSFEIVFDFYLDESVIRDPYHGIFCDGIFQSLQALEDISFDIWVGGYQWSRMDEDATFAGDQWGELDRQLAPSIRDGRFTHLKRIGVLVGVLDVSRCMEEHRDRIWRLVEGEVFNRQYSNLRELEKEGVLQLELIASETRAVEEDEEEDRRGECEDREEGGDE
ncbi:hypothetical protein NMY22_g12617 [Coprinellus aureogranulatus]|nr:hypothetical protein NMY22_g12617 [Coprinellus aureogranulatus]